MNAGRPIRKERDSHAIHSQRNRSTSVRSLNLLSTNDRNKVIKRAKEREREREEVGRSLAKTRGSERKNESVKTSEREKLVGERKTFETKPRIQKNNKGTVERLRRSVRKQSERAKRIEDPGSKLLLRRMSQWQRVEQPTARVAESE